MSRLLDAEEISRQVDDLPGWVHEPGRLRATYDAPDFPAAARLVAEVADEAEQMNHHPDIDLRWRRVTFTCSTHSAGGLTQMDVELAHRVAHWAGRVGARPVAVPRRVELALDVVDPDAVRPFWREGLGYVERTGPDGEVELHDPRGSLPPLWFQRMEPPRPGRGRFHLDVYLGTVAEAEALRDRLLGLGGTVVSDAHAPHWWVTADPEGNELCVCTA